MPIIPVPKVVPGTDILADQHNRVIDAVQDVTAGHDHNGANYFGKPVDHENLVNNNRPAGRTHVTIDTWLTDHMGSDPGSYNNEVHGLAVGNYVIGTIMATGKATAWGVATLSKTYDDSPDSNWTCYQATDVDTGLDWVDGLVAISKTWGGPDGFGRFWMPVVAGGPQGSGGLIRLVATSAHPHMDFGNDIDVQWFAWGTKN